MPGQTQFSEQVIVRVSPEDKQVIRQRAAACFMSMSAYIRTAVLFGPPEEFIEGLLDGLDLDSL